LHDRESVRRNDTENEMKLAKLHYDFYCGGYEPALSWV